MKLKKTIYLLFTLFLMWSCLFAQSDQTGTINGKILFEKKEPLPGITVILTSPSMAVSEMVAVTNENGKYYFHSLSPGKYTARFIGENFQTLVKKDIDVNIGRTSTIDVSMSLQKQMEEIEVKGTTPAIDRQSTMQNSIIDSKKIDMLPSGRTIGGFFNLTPGASTYALYGGSEISVHGGSIRGNAFNIDGVNLNNPFHGDNEIDLNADNIAEISVKSGGISAEYSDNTGAVINVITKSGGNSLSGSASVYYGHEKFRTDNTKEYDNISLASGDKFEIRTGFTLGGYLIKNKLWFFSSMAYDKRASYADGYPWRAKGDTTVKNIAGGVRKLEPFFKLTYQPSQNDKIYVSYQYSDYRDDHKLKSWVRTVDATSKYINKNHLYNAQWTHTFSSAFFTNAKISIVKKNSDNLAKNDSPLIHNTTLKKYAGSIGYNSYINRDQVNMKVDGSLFLTDCMGDHELKFGGSYKDNKYGKKRVNNGTDDPDNPGFKVYKYSYRQNDSGDLTPYRASSYVDYHHLLRMKKTGMFVQDSWSILDNLVLNVGVRGDFQRGIIPRQATGTGTQYYASQFFGKTRPYSTEVKKDLTAINWNNFAPRLGLIYDIFSNGSTLLKATYGRYYDALVFTNYDVMNPNKSTYYTGDFDPKTGLITKFRGGSRPKPASITWKDNKLTTPYTDEFTISLERILTDDLSASVRFIRKDSKDMLEDVNAAALDIDKFLKTGEVVWKNYEKKEVVDPYNGKTIYFWNKIDVSVEDDYYLVNMKGTGRRYTGIEFILDKKYANKYGFNFSYVYSKTEGLLGSGRLQTSGRTGFYDEPNVHINASGTLDDRHYFKLTGLYSGPFGINFGLKFVLFSGARYTRVVTAGYLGLNLNQGSYYPPIFAEKRGSRSLPWVKSCDLRIEKQFKLNKIRLKVYATIFNIFNETTVISRYANSSDNKYSRFQFDEPTNLTQPRMLRLGAKIEF